MNLGPIAERIRDECPLFKLVGGAAAFDKAQQGLTTIPAAFVLPAEESALPSPFADGFVQQHVDVAFVVAIAVRNVADATGAAAVDELEPVRLPLFDALLAWTPTGCDTHIEHKSGRFLSFGSGVIWWGDTFATSILRRSS